MASAPSPEPAPAVPDVAGSDGSDGPDGAEGPDDVKRRFREALDRKNGKQAAAAAAEGGEHTKVHGGAHGPAHTQRTFRRKSGG